MAQEMPQEIPKEMPQGMVQGKALKMAQGIAQGGGSRSWAWEEGLGNVYLGKWLREFLPWEMSQEIAWEIAWEMPWEMAQVSTLGKGAGRRTWGGLGNVDFNIMKR